MNGSTQELLRLRLVADELGLRLEKSRRRNPDAIDYGRYAVFDIETGGTVHPMLADRYPHALTLEDVRAYLS